MTTAATSPSGGGARKPSTASAPVISASLFPSFGMPPPVSAMILLFSAVGSMTSGPPQLWWPLSTLTTLSTPLSCTTAPLQLDALAPGQELGYVLRQEPADKDHDQPREQVPDREVPEREVQHPYPLGHAEPHEQLSRVYVRE